MEIARTDPERGRAIERVPPRGTHLLERSEHRRRRWHVREDGNVIPRAICGTQLCECERVEGRSMLRPYFTNTCAIVPTCQLRTRKLLRLLDVGLIECVDAEAFAQRLGRVFPAQKLGTQI